MSTCYVEKRHYDALFSAFSKAKAENAALKKAWSEMRDRTAKFDDRVLDSIHRFDTLHEENAYIIGSFNTMLAVRYDMEELEEKYNVK